MAATAKSASTEVAKTETTTTEAASATQAELNMVVSDTEDDEEFMGDDLSSFDEGAAPPEKDNPDLVILNKKIQEVEEAKKWKGANPTDNTVVKRPEQNPLHPNVYFDKYMGMKKLKAVEHKLRFARGVLRRFSGKDPKLMKTGNKIKLQRAEKILAKIIADHKGVPYEHPNHEVIGPTMSVEDLNKLNFRARNRIIIAAKKFVPKIEAKTEEERTHWEKVQYPFYKKVNTAFPEPVRASTEEIHLYNKTKNAIKAERKIRHKEDQLDKALNFIDYLLKYKEQNFTPMTRAKLDRSFEIIQKQFKFQGPNKVEPSKTQTHVVSKAEQAKKADAGGQQKQAQKTPAGNQQKGGNNNQSDNRKRPITSAAASGGNRGNPAKVARNDNYNRGGNNNNSNFPRRNNAGGGGGNQNFGVNRVADIWSSVGAALNQLSNQSNFSNNNQGGNFGGSQPDNFRRGGGNVRDQGRDNFNNSNISDIMFNRGGGGGSVGNLNSGFNDGPRRFNDDMAGSNFGSGDRYNSNYNDSRRLDDFNRGSGSNFNQGGNDFRGNNDFGGNSGYNQMGGGGGGGNYGNSGFNNSGGYGGLDLNRGNRAPIDDLFTRNRSRL